MSDTQPAPQPRLQATPAHVTGTAGGLAAAGAVLSSAIVGHFTGHPLSPGVLGAETTILTYILGTYLHVPQS